MSEQRLFLRKKVPLPIPIELLPGKEMWLHDIGEGGLSVSGSSRLEPGTATFFSFQFPDAGSIIEASGVVAWCDGSGRVGIRFTRVKPDSSAVLKRWLKADEKQASTASDQQTVNRPPAAMYGDAAALREEISRANLDFSKALDFLAERMKVRTRASGAAIALREADAVLCRATSGNAPPPGTPLDLDNTVTGQCYRSGNIVSITDTENDTRVDSELCRHLEFRSLLIVPIAQANELVGIVEVFSPLAGNFEGGDVLLLGSIAEVAAEIYGAQQRKPSASQPIPFLVSERVEQMPQSAPIHREEPQQEGPATDSPHSSSEAIANSASEAPRETNTEPVDTSSSVSQPRETSGQDENGKTESRWKLRSYLLLMAGLTVLGIGTGDVVDWHLTSRLARSSAQPASAITRLNIDSATTHDPELTEHDSALLTSAADLVPATPIAAAPLPLKNTSGAKIEKSSLALKSATQRTTSHSPVDDPPSRALLTPSEAVPLAGSVPNLDFRNTAQLTPAKLLHHVDPVVPDFAKSAGTDGTVLLSAVIGTDGRLKNVRFVSGDRALAIEAFRAVHDWRYRPYMLNGKPIEAETRIVMNFRP